MCAPTTDFITEISKWASVTIVLQRYRRSTITGENDQQFIKKARIRENRTSQLQAWDRYQHEIEAKCVSQSKMAAEDWNDLASATNTRGIS